MHSMHSKIQTIEKNTNNMLSKYSFGGKTIKRSNTNANNKRKHEPTKKRQKTQPSEEQESEDFPRFHDFTDITDVQLQTQGFEDEEEGLGLGLGPQSQETNRMLEDLKRERELEMEVDGFPMENYNWKF